MSNERVIRAAEAVNDLQAALEVWRGGAVPPDNRINTRAAANDAVAAIDSALAELQAIRRETRAEARTFDDATMARVDALLARTTTPRPPQLPADYKCGDCGQVFPIDSADPIESHGAYLDHMDEHEHADAIAEPHDPAELDVPANCSKCDGCGQIANDDDGTPWTFWADLKPPSNMAVTLGLVSPIPCPRGCTPKAAEVAR